MAMIHYIFEVTANLWPRLVSRIEPRDPTSPEPATVFPNGRVRDEIGVSQRSLSPAHALVENNLFIGCRGENENICNKSCDNVYRFNTFGNGCSELSLRHQERAAQARPG